MTKYHWLCQWQEWKGSNPQPPVLETGALPVELHSYWAFMLLIPQDQPNCNQGFNPDPQID